ncbi:hypothetical protein FHX37_4186 [Haloactinospora alba]|uniref:Uncharacterized protein n=1 Tax=Haloactinospora alba TaxID=405555 RepID=A0A543NAE8_9ACTN|nr:hypothetical protein [Haloactinospora alba]TQN28821.1 hypothetical protein FHX37_4186 [Haloactinospora alba]
MERPWEVDTSVTFQHRLGKSASELGYSRDSRDCPDIWELSNGDVAIVGRDVTEHFSRGLPDGVSVGSDERLVVIPGTMLRAAKSDIPDL